MGADALTQEYFMIILAFIAISLELATKFELNYTNSIILKYINSITTFLHTGRLLLLRLGSTCLRQAEKEIINISILL